MNSLGKKGSLGKYIFYFVLISLTAIAVTIYAYTFYNVVGYVEYQVNYSIGDSIGFNLDEGPINFGTVIPGTRTARNIEIKSDKDAIVNIYIEDLDDVSPDENNFFIEAGETRSVDIVLFIPGESEYGDYSGKIRIIFRRP
tara:strand:+ start:6555 stop:6977 length:423 start_codon:yes stop_codon:yes gene_type:complete